MVNGVKLILASGSPRRKQLLKGLGVDFIAIPPDVDEKYDSTMQPEKVSQYLAVKKAKAIIESYPKCAVIAADTIVSIKDVILEKPKDKLDATIMLRKLSGNWHEVLSGVCIMYKGETTVFCEITRVHFKELEDSFIKWYVDTNEPMDKAGAYGIQGYGAMLVDSIEGDFYNVMGFPISKVMCELARLDIYDIRDR